MNKSQFPFPSHKTLNCRSDSGFALVLLISLLPVLITLALVVPMGLHVLQLQKAQRHECRVGLLRYQETAQKTIRQMQALNTQAYWLRLRKIAAFILIAVPQTSAEGFRQLKIVQQQQKLLGIRQKFILNLGKVRMAQTLMQTNSRIRQAGTSKLLRTSTSFTPNYQISIAIRPDEPSDDAPVYVLENDFSRKQTKQVSWKSRFEFMKTEDWKQWVGAKWVEQSQSCAATLVENRNQIDVRLTRAKSWLNF